jgi:hypothetical protein
MFALERSLQEDLVVLALPALRQQQQQLPDSANHSEWAALPLLLFRPNNSFAAVAETVWRREGC